MIRVAALALLLTGCARTTEEQRAAIAECQRHAPPWSQADCYRAAAQNQGEGGWAGTSRRTQPRPGRTIATGSTA